LTENPVLDFGVEKSAIQYIGSDLQRPECILAEPDGTLWSADARGGVVRITPDGKQQTITQQRSSHFQGVTSEASRYLEGTLPNGLAFARNGDILISNFGTDCLEVMTREGATTVLEEFMYVVETTGGCVSRLRVGKDGSLSNREVFGPSNLGKGAWPDGIAFDSLGNLWGTMVYSDKLFVLTPRGDFRLLLDEGDAQKVDELERAFFGNQVNEQVLFATGQGIAPWMASVTFGGPDLQTIYIGSLKGKRIPYFRAPAPGLPMVHWRE
jgi:sugar lactone lactonase YvrE